MNILSVKNIKVKFDEHAVLSNLDFEIKRDETVAIIGPNGAGKTVLFKVILGLIPYEGKIEWASDVKIGYVPQKLLIGKDVPLTVNEFLKTKESSQEKIIDSLKTVGFFENDVDDIHRGNRLLKTRLGALSGGELQRVLIVFALLGGPNVLLFDEPTAGVDLSGEETVYALLNKLKKAKDLTIIFISHELDVVYKYADSVLCLNKKMICFGPPRKVIDKNSLETLYGEEINLHKHEEHHHGK